MPALGSREVDAGREQWRLLAQLTGFASDRGNKASVDALLNYFKREDVWPEIKEDRVKSFNVAMGKIMRLEWMGIVGSD